MVLLLACVGCLDPSDGADDVGDTGPALSDEPVELVFVGVSDWAGRVSPFTTTVPIDRGAGFANCVPIPVIDDNGDMLPPERCVVALGGAATLDAHWDRDRAAVDGRLRVVATGDSYGVSPALSSFFEERPAVLALNAMGLDVDTLGNHNFDRGLEHLQEMLDLADYTTLGANLTDVPQNVRGVAPYRLQMIGGVPVAFIGLVDPVAPSAVFPGSFGTMTVRDPLEPLLETRELAAAAGATVFVVAAHLGTDDPVELDPPPCLEAEPGCECPDHDVDPSTPECELDPERSRNVNASGDLVALFEAAQAATDNGFALMVGYSADRPLTCSSTDDGLRCLDHAEVVPDQRTVWSGAGPVLTQNSPYGTTYLRTHLTVIPRTGEIVDSRVDLVLPEVDRLEPSADVEAVLQPFETELAVIFDEPLTVTADTFRIGDDIVVPPDADEVDDIRGHQLALGSLIADAMRSRSGADLAVMNAGGIRDALPSTYAPQDPALRRPGSSPPPWDVVLGDVANVLPFVNSVVTQPVTEAEIFSMLENSVSSVPNARFLQVSGVRYWYDGQAPPGERVCTVALVDGAREEGLRLLTRDGSDRFTLATVDFVAQGGDDYDALTNAQGVLIEPLWDSLEAYLRTIDRLDPASTGPARITDVAGDRSLCPTTAAEAAR